MKSNKTKILLYISLLCIGIVIGIAIRHYYNLPLSVDINIIDVATLVATVFLAVYIPEVLDRNFQEIKDKKDVILKKVEELHFLNRKINILVQNEIQPNTKSILIINNTLDLIENKLQTLKTLVKLGNLKINFSPEINKIETLIREHKVLIFNNTQNLSDFNFNEEIKMKEEIIFNHLDHNFCLLIFKIA